MMRRGLMLLAWSAALAGAVFAQAPNEEVARRQLESGRAFARQGNYTEAMKDFRAVADTHSTSSVADNALLEIARYYIDVAGDMAAAAAAVDSIVKKYATSDSAPEAYLLAGRLALARSHQGTDLDAALANFERVFRLFPASDAVPRALALGGETMWYARRPDDALTYLNRVIAEFPSSPSAADAYLMLGRVLVARGEPIQAMEELQQVRNRWPNTPAAASALAQTTLLHRLYLRAKGAPAYTLSPDTIGPVRLQNVVALALSSRPTLYYAGEAGLGILTANSPDKAQTVVRPRGLTVDRTGAVVAFDAASLRPGTGAPITLSVPQSNGTPKALSNIEAAAQFSNGDWLITDGNDRNLQRFSATGTHVGVFAPGRLAPLVVSGTDDVVGIDKDAKTIVIFDSTGKSVARIPLRGAGYNLEDVEDLAVDTFGHLYVLDRTAIGIFSPHPAGPAPAAAAATPVTAAAARATSYRLLTLFAPPESDTTAFKRATAFALDPAGAVYLYDDRAEKIMVYR
jgi:TolA-binding protein